MKINDVKISSLSVLKSALPPLHLLPPRSTTRKTRLRNVVSVHARPGAVVREQREAKFWGKFVGEVAH